MSSPLLLAAVNGQQGSPSPISGVGGALLFVGLPVLVLLVVAALVVAGTRAADAFHYRPGRGWAHAPVWFGDVPPEVGTEPETGTKTADAPLAGIGGTSARW